MPRKVLLLVVFLLAATGFAITGCSRQPLQSTGETSARESKPYQVKDYSRIMGMKGFSGTLLENHFKLYQGYVKNTNLLLGKLKSAMDSANEGSPEYSELKRRLGFEFNGMRLHELYFANLGGNKPLDSESAIHRAIVANFGSMKAWEQEFTAAGSIRGIGWVILYLDPQTGRLINFWINEHEVNHPAGCLPLLVMDVWEHAYMPDYGLDRGKYVGAFLNHINWDEVARRYDRSLAAASAAEAQPESLGAPGGEAKRMFEKPHA